MSLKRLSSSSYEKLTTAGMAALCCGAAHFVFGARSDPIFLVETVLCSTAFLALLKRDHSAKPSHVIRRVERRVTQDFAKFIEIETLSTADAAQKASGVLCSIENILPEILTEDAAQEIASASANRQKFINILLERAAKRSARFDGSKPENQLEVAAFSNIVGSVFDELLLNKDIYSHVVLKILSELASNFAHFDERFARFGERLDSIESSLSPLPRIEVIIGALLDRQLPGMQPAATALAPQGGGRLMTVEQANPTVAIRFDGQQEGAMLAMQVSDGIRVAFVNSRWFDVLPGSISATETLAARYHIVGQIQALGSKSIWVGIAATAGPGLPSRLVESKQFTYANGLHASTLADQINGWAQKRIFKWEYIRGQENNWESENVQQLLIWAYLLWAKRNPGCNALARDILLRAATLGYLNTRVWSLLAQTYVEAIHQGWCLNKEAAIEQVESCARRCREAVARPDAETWITLSHSARFRDDLEQATKYLEWAMEENADYLVAPIFWALNHSFEGRFSEAVEILELSLSSASGDPAFGLGKQIQGQAHFLLGDFEAGHLVSLESMRANPSAVAGRSAAANLVGMGRHKEARRTIQETQDVLPVTYSAKALRNQGWRDGHIEPFFSAVVASGVLAA